MLQHRSNFSTECNYDHRFITDISACYRSLANWGTLGALAIACNYDFDELLKYAFKLPADDFVCISFQCKKRIWLQSSFLTARFLRLRKNFRTDVFDGKFRKNGVLGSLGSRNSTSRNFFRSFLERFCGILNQNLYKNFQRKVVSPLNLSQPIWVSGRVRCQDDCPAYHLNSSVITDNKVANSYQQTYFQGGNFFFVVFVFYRAQNEVEMIWWIYFFWIHPLYYPNLVLRPITSYKIHLKYPFSDLVLRWKVWHNAHINLGFFYWGLSIKIIWTSFIFI